MDAKLVGWARAVKARRPWGLPPLWLFTDAVRMPEPADVVRRLPKGLCGVVFRHDQDPRRAEKLHRVWLVCRSRRLMLSVAGAGPLPPGAGRHMRRGFGTKAAPFRTASAHGRVELVRAARLGAGMAFVSPVFPTGSHPGAAALGVVRFAALALRAGVPVCALGGVDGRSVRHLPRGIAGVGAIGALSDDNM